MPHLLQICFERLSDKNQANVIEAFNSASRSPGDFLNIDTPYFEQIVSQIFSAELQLNEANLTDNKAHFLDLITNLKLIGTIKDGTDLNL